jgi:hypothetical protein
MVSYLPAVFHQGEQIGQPRAGAGMPNLQPVLGAEFQWANAIFHQVVFDAGAWFGQTAQQRSVLSAQIPIRQIFGHTPAREVRRDLFSVCLDTNVSGGVNHYAVLALGAIEVMSLDRC